MLRRWRNVFTRRRTVLLADADSFYRRHGRAPILTTGRRFYPLEPWAGAVFSIAFFKRSLKIDTYFQIHSLFENEASGWV